MQTRAAAAAAALHIAGAALRDAGEPHVTSTACVELFWSSATLGFGGWGGGAFLAEIRFCSTNKK